MTGLAPQGILEVILVIFYKRKTKLPDTTKGKKEVIFADKVVTLLPSSQGILEVKLGKFLTGIARNYLISPKGKGRSNLLTRLSHYYPHQLGF